MSFNTVGIQDNLPVLPIHVLQIIESLKFTGQYSAEDFFREGRTNFGAAAFTSSAHVEMHSLNGADPLVVYSGPYDDTQVFSIDAGGTTIATQLTASDATIITLAVANEAVGNSSITTALIDDATIQTALVSNLTATNGIITTLNSTVAAAVTFTASNAQITNTATIDTATIDVANITTDNVATAYITTGYIDNLDSMVGVVDDLTSTDITVTNDIAITNNASVGNDLTVAGDTSITGDATVGGALTSGQVTIDYQNTDYVNANGNNSHIKLSNTDPSGQTSISSVINGRLTGKIRNDFAGNLQYIASGSGTGGNHYFFTQGDYPGGAIRFAISSSGNVGIGTQTPTTKLQVVGTAKATQFEGPLEGTASWAVNVVNGGVAGNPAGTNGQVQYNNSGVFGAIPSLVYVGGNLAATGSFTGSLTGNLTGTASFASLAAGPGIVLNGMAVSASIVTVNGQFPVNGNVQASLSSTKTGDSASLILSSSGAITASLADGLVWVISNDATTTNNGKVYIYTSASVGQWYPVAPLDLAASDARYLKLDGANDPMTGDLDMGTNQITNVGTLTVNGAASADSVIGGNYIGVTTIGQNGYIYANNLTAGHSYELPDQGGVFAVAVTSSLGQTTADSEGNINIETVPTASFITASNVYGPYGANSVVSASWAPATTVDTTSFITTGSLSSRQGITGSLAITGSAAVTGSLVIANNTDFSRPFRLGAAVANIGSIYPVSSIANLTTNWNNLLYTGTGFTYTQAQFPVLRPYSSFGGSSSGGGNVIAYTAGHLGIGNNTEDLNTGDRKLEALFLHTTQTAGPDAGSLTAAQGVVRTIITDNNTISTAGTLNTIISGIYTANNRAHVLSVTGSMLARDGVSLGTNIANSHIITGSVNMTGSFTLNGTNLSTLTSPVQSVKVTVSSAQLLNLSLFSPLTLVPAQGSGKVIRPLSIAMVYNYGTTNYIGGSLVANYGGGGSYMLSSNIHTSYSTNKIQFYNPGGGSQVWDLSAATNQPVILAAQSAITNGDGTLTVYVDYTVLSL